MPNLSRYDGNFDPEFCSNDEIEVVACDGFVGFISAEFTPLRSLLGAGCEQVL